MNVPLLAAYEKKIYSQNGEDGILEYIFSRIGTTNKRFVEFGFGTPEANTTNLALNEEGWTGLLLDGSQSVVEAATRYYKDKNPGVTCGHCFITVDNINSVLRAHGITNTIDLLSIDIDGNDYWIWQAITVIDPRVVVIEYNAAFNSDKSLVVKYDPEFARYSKHSSGLYYGASLLALTRLAHNKGYLLVGCDSTGTNAFFVRKDVAKDKLPEVAVEEAFVRFRGADPDAHFRRIKELEYEVVM